MIKIENLTKKFGAKMIFENFSLTVEKNEMVAVVGSSGTGKSTLLNIIGLIENFDVGTYRLDGQQKLTPNSRRAQKIIREKISYLFQNYALIDQQTVAENLQLALTYTKKSKAEKVGMIDEVLKKVGLPNYQKYKVCELSGGEQQRVAIARALIKPSELVLADEPTGSLDAKNRDEVINLLQELNRQGKTVVIVTHDPLVSKCCSREIRLNLSV